MEKAKFPIISFALLAVIVFSLFALPFECVAQTTVSSDWPMFRANPAHTGKASGTAVLTPSLLWNYGTGGFVGSPSVANGVVYIGSSDKFYALNADTGVELWNRCRNSGEYSSPAIVNGVVYVGDWDNVYALQASSGAQIWDSNIKYDMGAYEYLQPML